MPSSYKNLLFCIRVNYMNIAWFASEQPVVILDGKIHFNINLISITITVSYTHLDVYKRQAQILTP